MKRYTVRVVIEEGSDEFWESLRSGTGCDEVVTMVRDALQEAGLYTRQCTVSLAKFVDTDGD